MARLAVLLIAGADALRWPAAGGSAGFVSILPGYGELAVARGKTPVGNAQRIWLLTLLFTDPRRVPRVWIREQSRRGGLPGTLEAGLAGMRSILGPLGQREVCLDRLPQLGMPTLVLLGACDKIFPAIQARAAGRRLQHGRLKIIPDCGHMPHVERPELLSEVLEGFLGEVWASPGKTDTPKWGKAPYGPIPTSKLWKTRRAPEKDLVIVRLGKAEGQRGYDYWTELFEEPSTKIDTFFLWSCR